jgi:COP9 signalosome complex subunit 1
MSLPDAPLNEPEVTATATVTATAAATAFDLDVYIGRYAPGSETRIQRLVFIAKHTTDESIKQSALDLLEHQLKESGNTVRYQQVFAQKDQEGSCSWLTKTRVANEAALEILEARLSAAQANLNKDAIRNAYLNIGEFLLQRGQVRDALRHVLRARDYCTNRAQTLFICWKVIELAMNTCTYVRRRR